MANKLFKNLALSLPSPLTLLADDRLEQLNIRLYLKRDDLVHPEIPGNKWRKLKYNLTAAGEGGYRTLLTFGGAYSNHIKATAAAGAYGGFSTIGVIRGEEYTPLNESLSHAASQGMQLIYMDRGTYSHKEDQVVIDRLHNEFGNFYLIPEGGANILGIKGCEEIIDEITIPFDILCCSVGTAATLAGMTATLREGQRAIGFSALKRGQFLAANITHLQWMAYGRSYSNWTIEPNFHFGGYAKINSDLKEFIEDFKKRHGILLDWVYEAKMMAGIFSLVEDKKLPEGSAIVAVIAG